MRILIAPNAFKNSLDATDAADAIRRGLARSGFMGECFPIGDGGDGTGELLTRRLGGVPIPCRVHDPLGREITAHFGWVAGTRTAVVEMAAASGLRLLKPEERDVIRADSYGTGELIRAALEQGAEDLLLCVGGSATVDGGAGILKALGPSGMNGCRLTILCDVETSLGAAARIFGPQKGATPADVEVLEERLARLADLAYQQTGKRIADIRYGGAAGGTAAGLYAFLGAALVGGTDHFLRLTGFEERLADTDLVITGEGSIDEQTLDGKAPYGVALRAQQRNIPVIGLAGKVPPVASERLRKYFSVLMAIGHEPSDLADALSRTKEDLERVGEEIGRLLALGGGMALPGSPTAP